MIECTRKAATHWKLVMAGLVPAIPLTQANGFWKMDGRHKGGHDD